MKQVKIINGIYGYRPKGSRFLQPAGAGAIVTVPDGEAERLVSLKVGICLPDGPGLCHTGTELPAEASMGTQAVEFSCEEEDGEKREKDAAEDAAPLEAAEAEALEGMTRAQLEELAREHGVDTGKCRTKGEVLELLRKADEPPVLEAEVPVP